MKNITVKESFWFDFKNGKLLRFVGIFLPIAIFLYFDSKYDFNDKQNLLFTGLYLVFHGLWTYLSKNFPIFATTTTSAVTIIVKKRFALILSYVLIFLGLYLVYLSYK